MNNTFRIDVEKTMDYDSSREMANQIKQITAEGNLLLEVHMEKLNYIDSLTHCMMIMAHTIALKSMCQTVFFIKEGSHAHQTLLQSHLDNILKIRLDSEEPNN